jgi:hypothetical protein
MEFESDEDIFIHNDEQEKPKKQRKRKPREMSDETRERMAAILAKGRETRLKNNQLKREALENDKQKIKETLKTKLKEVKKQLKEELVNETIGKKKNESKNKLEDNEPPKSTKPELINPEPPKSTKPELINPESPKSSKSEEAAPVALIQAPPKPNLSMEYMRKLRAVYNF